MKFRFVSFLSSLTFIVTVISSHSHAFVFAPATFEDNFSAQKDVWQANDDIWKYENGMLTAETKESNAFDRFYACKYYAGGDYELSISVKVDKAGEWGGGGLVFNSEKADSLFPSMMARLIACRAVTSGYFTSHYNDVASKEFEEPLLEGWHKIKTVVRGNEMKYDVYVDDRKIIENAETKYDRGYFGITISDGNVSFKDFKFRQIAPAKPVEKFQISKWLGITIEKELIGFDMLNNNVLFFDMNGGIVRSFKAPDGIYGFCSNNRGYIAVFATTKPVVNIYDEEGMLYSTIELKDKSGNLINEISAAVLDEHNFLYIMDGGSKTIYRIKGRSTPVQLSVETNDSEANLASFAVSGQYLYIIDNQAFVYIYRWHNPPAKPVLTGKFRTSGGGSIHSISTDGRDIYVIEGKKVCKYSKNGIKTATYRGWKLPSFEPVALKNGAKNEVYVAEQTSNSVLTLTSVIEDNFPKVEFKNPATAEIIWGTAYGHTGTVKLYKDGTLLKTYLDRKTSKRHSVIIEGLEKNMRYEFSVEPAESAIPGLTVERRYPFVTPAGKGMTQYFNYPIAVILFTDVIDDSKQKPDWPDTMKPIPAGEIERFKKEIMHTCTFYFVNSHMKFCVRPDFFIVEKKYKRSEVFGRDSSYPPKDGLIREILNEKGKKPEDFNAVLYVPAIQEYSEKTGEYFIRGAGGGYTSGTDGKKHGTCWWEMTMKDHGAGNDWLMLHEFNHQTDSLHYVSGHPEYWFNHYGLMEDNVGKFYWWYSADGYLIREATPSHWWLNLRFGNIIATEDKDEDGIPDDDSNVWMDEKRLRTDPTKKDTDGDGISDLKELMSWNNSDRGWGEDYGGKKYFPDPTKSDSDGDGIPDGKDKFPMYPINFEITKASHDIQKPFGTAEWNLLYTIEDPRIKYSVYGNWDDDFLYFAVETAKDAMVSIGIDAGADGWFTGANNYRFQWGYRGRDFSYELYDCSNPTKFGVDGKKLIERDFVCRIEEKDNRKVLLFSLKKNEKTGLTLKKGDVIALNITCGPPANPYGWSRYVSYLEPNHLFDFTLVGK